MRQIYLLKSVTKKKEEIKPEKELIYYLRVAAEVDVLALFAARLATTPSFVCGV
jgi:hypothetical protein